jgi:primosomal protein N' (replication factor Y)
MLVQTWHPNHALYASLREYNYTAFAQSQLNDRAMAGLPPFSFLALLRAEARQAQIAKDFLKDAREAAQAWLINQSLASDVLMIYPAVPPSLAKVAGVERVQMLIESSSRPILQKFLHAWNSQLHFLRMQHKGLLRWALDVDPLMI